MSRLEELKTSLEQEGLTDKNVDLEFRYYSAIRNEKVREILEIETPPITDLTDVFQTENEGRLYAVRMDLNKGVDNHTKPIVAGLILRGVLNRRIPEQGIDTLIDAGNYNSATAVKYYAEKFDMNGVYVMSRLFPQDVIDILKSEDFGVIVAPEKRGKPLEREFYEYLVQLMKDQDFRSNKFCLWHARDGGEAMYPIGRELAEALEQIPDYIVSCCGTGSTLKGLQIAIQDYFAESGAEKTPSIVVGEHELSPLFVSSISSRKSLGCPPCVERAVKAVDPGFYEHVDGLPHIVVGPHYDEINPLLAKDAIARIDEVVQYSERDWMAMQKYLEQRGISVGNSSAANLSVAANLANEGHKVVTVIFEPFRSFYKRHSNVGRAFGCASVHVPRTSGRRPGTCRKRI